MDLFNAAVRIGRLDTLKWQRNHELVLNSILNGLTIAAAANGGHLDIIKYLRKIGVQWDWQACANAANIVLKWVRTNGCPWSVHTCANAGSSGHIQVLKWARTTGCPWNLNAQCSRIAINGHFEVLKWPG